MGLWLGQGPLTGFHESRSETTLPAMAAGRRLRAPGRRKPGMLVSPPLPVAVVLQISPSS